MNFLYSEEGMQRLDDIVRPGLLCAFDFDGTLAPIVPLPEQARLPDYILQRLTTLMEYAPVAVITGRSIKDISERLGFDPDFIIGNHGLEGVPGWEDQAARHEVLCIGWRTQLSDALQDRVFDSGIQLEDKRYSLSLHYRHARDPDLAAAMLDQLFARLVPRPRVVGGKYVYNLLAEDACDKGRALERLMDASRASSAIYVGDDVTDEDVFRLRRSDLLSIRIERSLESAADFFLPHPGDILQFLEALSGRLRMLGARNWMLAETASST